MYNSKSGRLGVGLLVAAAALLLVPAQAAVASSTITAVTAGGFTLTPHQNNTSNGTIIDSTLTSKRTSLTAALGTEITHAEAGLCYPTPFNPGVSANGYCWTDPEDITGNTHWEPQGFAVPHDSSRDGQWGGARWELVAWHHGPSDEEIRLRFVNRSDALHYVDVALVVFGQGGSVVRRGGHADGVAWYGNKIYIGYGHVLDIADLGDLTAYTGIADYNYVLPVRYTYMTTTAVNGSGACVPDSGNTPCLNGLSFDRARSGLISNEYDASTSNGRLVAWNLNLTTGLPTGSASGAWTTPVWGMQGVTEAQGAFFVSGLCPSSYNNSYRQPACVHTGSIGGGTHVLSEVPDMTEGIDWDSSTGRIRGVNEVEQYDRALPQRLVFDFLPVASGITVGRFRNINSNMCMLPYAASLNDGAYLVQAACDGKSAQNWYWDGNQMRSFVSNSCITAQGTAVNSHIIEKACNGSASQSFTRETGNGGAMLRNAASGLCMVPYAGSKSSGADIMLGNCDAGSLAYAWGGYTP
jgi:hypothetical protein